MAFPGARCKGACTIVTPHRIFPIHINRHPARIALPATLRLFAARTVALVAVLITLVLGGQVMAESLSPGQPTHIHASLAAEHAGAPGETVTLALVMQPARDWHGYWSNPGDAGLPPTLDWTLPKGAATGPMQFPVPQTLLVAGLMNHVYEHDFALLIPFTLPRDAAPGSNLPISAKAQWLACTAAICVPEEATLSATVTVAAPGAAAPADPRFAAWRAALPAALDQPARFAVTATGYRLSIPFPATTAITDPHVFIADDGVIDYAAPQRFARAGDSLIIDLAKSKSPAPQPASTLSGVLALGHDGDGKDRGGITFAAQPGTVAAGGTPIAGNGGTPVAFSWALLGFSVLGALAGGLVLNVMPCVFPILSLKALALARGNSQHAHVEALAYTAGVMLACLALGGVMLGLRAAGSEVGWAFQLQDPGVVAVLLLLAMAITANFAGLYELPGLSLSGGAPGKGGAWGAFGTGLLAAFVATPCTGPFMAAAMGAALVLPVWAALAVFGALGLGLALPFLAIGFIPALRRVLPRPGAWMVWFRRAMAVPMGLTVLALAWLAWRLGGNTYAAAAIALAVAMLLLLGLAGRGQHAGRSVATWLAPALVVVAVVAGAGAPRLANAERHDDASLIGATPFSQAALDAARAARRPVFAYFTADWCLSCKVNENVSIETAATAAAFKKAGVVVLVGDWTRRDPAITRFLTSAGAAGVPLYLWYPAGGEPQKLAQVMTPSTLADLAAK
ncbi:protein-disulfide reductase DsbD domain-containing protein [Novosphingobium sp.]|uniref:protein-disulfide reductase DsbD family protein n=1 Tax=Novosphingobium sp. TaxID=1874826 RepID=UPI003340DF22